MSSPHRPVLRTLSAAGALILLLTAVPAATPTDPPAYNILDLGTLGGPSSDAFGITTSGRVVGSSTTADVGTHAFRWEPIFERMVDVGPPGRPSMALGINLYCEVVGTFTPTSGRPRAFLRRRDGTVLDLGTFPGGADAIAYGVNGTGDVVGTAVTAAGAARAFSRLVPRFPEVDVGLFDLGTLGGSNSRALAINDAGQVVGAADTRDFRYHAFRRTFRTGPALEMLDLGTLGGEKSEAYGINTIGEAVGTAGTANGQSHAFRWTPRGMQDLGTLGGGFSAAVGINNAGEIVGRSFTAGGRQHAFLYTNAAGMVDLNSRIDLPLGEAWELTEARGINDVGWIVGSGIHNGQQRAFLLKPIGGEIPPAAPDTSACPEPQAFGAPVHLPLIRIAVFRPSTREWIVRNVDGSRSAVQFGETGDQPVPADYLGLGYDQIAVFRPGTRQWLIRRDDRTTVGPIQFGEAGDVPVPADYLGLDRDQIAVFRPSTREWRIRTAVDDSRTQVISFGEAGDVPVAADYFPLPPVELAVFRPSGQQWSVRRRDGRTVGPFPFGAPGDRPVPGNYLGGKLGFGRDQIAVVRPSNMQWFIRNDTGVDGPAAEAQTIGPIRFGEPGAVPVPGSYTGTDRIQLAAFHPSTRVWRIRKDDGTELPPIQFGEPGDQPVPGAYPYRLGR